MLKSTCAPLSAIADIMPANDPTALIDRLMAVKPAGLSRNAWATNAGVNRNVFTDAEKRGRLEDVTLDKLLEVIGMTWAQFDAGERSSRRDAPTRAVRAPYMAFRGDDRPRDIPVLGTAECAEVEVTGEGGAITVESMVMDLDEIVDYARRPVSLDNRRDIYAIYFRGQSMEPRFEPGEIAYVDPKRPPTARDYVVVQLRQPHGDEERVYTAMAKRLVKQTASYVELEQFNPAMTFRLARKQVMHIHRIVPWDELVTF